MLETAIIVICTTLLTSVFTVVIAHFVFKNKMQNRYDQALTQAIERIKEEVGPEIEARVKQGVVEGIKSLPSKEVLRDTTRTIAKTGLDFVGDSIKLATRPRGGTRRPGPTPFDDD